MDSFMAMDRHARRPVRPGGGVHGMSGYYAARILLRHEFGVTDMPKLTP
jgi:hypothetical protein